jgi:hypothetical protein
VLANLLPLDKREQLPDIVREFAVRHENLASVR